MTKTTTSKRPEYLAYMVEDGKGDNAFWTRVGTLWAHEDGEGYTLQLEALPLNGRLMIRKPKPKTSNGGAAR
jgi:hypothetical protein